VETFYRWPCVWRTQLWRTQRSSWSWMLYSLVPWCPAPQSIIDVASFPFTTLSGPRY
jgi:hypothetical protein